MMCRNGVNVVFRNSEGHFLFVRQRYDGRRWILLGGGVELGESYDETAEREIWEEGGVVIFADELIHVADFTQKVKTDCGNFVEGTLRLFEASRFLGDLRQEPSEEVEGYGYFSLDYILDNREEFSVGYIRMILHYERYRQGLVVSPFHGRLSEPVECEVLACHI